MRVNTKTVFDLKLLRDFGGFLGFLCRLSRDGMISEEQLLRFFNDADTLLVFCFRISGSPLAKGYSVFEGCSIYIVLEKPDFYGLIDQLDLFDERSKLWVFVSSEPFSQIIENVVPLETQHLNLALFCVDSVLEFSYNS